MSLKHNKSKIKPIEANLESVQEKKVYYSLKRVSLRSSLLLRITIDETGKAEVEELRDDVHMVCFGKLTKLLGDIDA